MPILCYKRENRNIIDGLKKQIMKEEKTLLCILPDSMSESDIKKLEQNNFVVIVVKSMDSMRLMSDTKFLNGNEIFMTALKSIREHNNSDTISVKTRFAQLLIDTYFKNESKV